MKPAAQSASNRRRMWGETVGGHGDGGRHDSVGVVQQTGGGEIGVGWPDCGGGAGRPDELVRHMRAEGVGWVGRLGRDCNSGPGPVPRSQYPFPILQLLQI
jgi:hypothetical protein